jgi:hypothetical protein
MEPFDLAAWEAVRYLHCMLHPEASYPVVSVLDKSVLPILPAVLLETLPDLSKVEY